MLFIPKKNNVLKIYINYYKLNTITKKDKYPLPLIKEILNHISKARIYTKIDI